MADVVAADVDGILGVFLPLIAFPLLRQHMHGDFSPAIGFCLPAKASGNNHRQHGADGQQQIDQCHGILPVSELNWASHYIQHNKHPHCHCRHSNHHPAIQPLKGIEAAVVPMPHCNVAESHQAAQKHQEKQHSVHQHGEVRNHIPGDFNEMLTGALKAIGD